MYNANHPKWLIYGANGYSGQLIAREAKAQHLTPILAGRNQAAVQKLGLELHLETKVFSCTTVQEIIPHLQGITLVLHCAGPFSKTSKPMLEACLQTKTHYLDITGEIPVFERLQQKKQNCKNASIVAISGVGFDVVPSDCLIALLKQQMPNAQELNLALKARGPLSPGTTKTLIEGAYAGVVIRRAGKITFAPHGFLRKQIYFSQKSELAVSISWGDISTAYYSTNIPNITVYLASTKVKIIVLQFLYFLKPILKQPFVQNFLKKLSEKFVPGPNEEERAQSRYTLWAEVRNKNKTIEAWLDTPNGYTLTADSAVKVVQEVFSGKIKPGAYTPAQALGPEFILKLKDVNLYLHQAPPLAE